MLWAAVRVCLAAFPTGHRCLNSASIRFYHRAQDDLEERFGARVELSLLAEGPSLERLAQLVRARASEEAEAIARSGSSDLFAS